MTIKDYSSTAASNTVINGVSIVGGAKVSNMDDGLRQLMADISNWTDSDTLTSGTTTDLGSVQGRYVTVSGTATITGFGTLKAGMFKTVYFSGAGQITHNATSMILPGAADISRAAGDVGVFVSEGSGNWRCISYEVSGTGARGAPKGHIYGLTLSNNTTDATNDIDIAVGEAASDGSTPALITLASSLTKRLDAAWAVGTGNGGLDTGSIANTTYHVWLIQRSDTGVVDALFSTSATSPTMPANYDRKRRIGAILRESGAIVAFSQTGDIFLRKAPSLDFNAIVPTTTLTPTLAVPTGVKVTARLRCQMNNSSTISSAIALLTSPDEDDRVPNATSGDFNIQQQVVGVPQAFLADVLTSTLGRIRLRSGSASNNIQITTYGWVDTRGQA